MSSLAEPGAERVHRVFGPLVVNKREALAGGLERMPRFVTEFLIASARAQRQDAALHDIRARIHDHSVDADRKNELVSRLMRDGAVTLITLLEVEPRPLLNDHVARVQHLDGLSMSVAPALVEQHPALLYGGLWGAVTLRYEARADVPTITVESFQPYQLSSPDLEAFRRARAHFSFEEWVDLMVVSAGYAPDTLPSLRHKLLLLCRLVPLAQGNANVVELGPRSTGKSYLLRNLSPRVYLSSGGRLSPASFFYDLARKRLGLVGTRKVLVLDEISATMVPDESFVAGLLDYMETGSISRGGQQMTSDCSLVITGNVELAADGQRPSEAYPHLFSVFPGAMVKSALVDRVHAFIPGWELPKISDRNLADGPGLLSDYFGEVLTGLRRDPSFIDLVRERLAGLRAEPHGLTMRDQRAIERTVTGLVRFLFPDRQLEEEGFLELVQVAIELRQRVHAQLCRMSPGEFRPKTIRYGELPAPELPESAEAEHEALDARMNGEEVVGQTTLLYVSGNGGGDRGFVQCERVATGRRLRTTGLRGKVLDESIHAAYDALAAVGHRVGLSGQQLDDTSLRLHLVDIAQNRDGPSAGLAFALAMYSAATGRPLRRGLAITGELSVAGDVRRVGGIAEKLEAAQRRGRQVVLIPAANAPDLAKLPELAAALAVHPVATFEEAVQLALA